MNPEAIVVEQYHKFCEEFIAHIKAGRSDAADNLLTRNKGLYGGLLAQYHPFDAQIETLLQHRSVEQPFVRIIEMARMLEVHELSTDTIRAYQLGALVSVGNIDSALDYLEANPAIQDTAGMLLSIYATLEGIDGPRRALMEKAIHFNARDETVIDLAAALKMGPEHAEKKV